MARAVDKLSAVWVAKTKEVGYHGDGNGLYLQVSPSHSKSWIFRFKVAGKAREMGLGALHTFSLAEARQRAKEARQLVAEGRDPIDARRTEIQKAARAAANDVTFKQAAEAYIAANGAGWKNAKHAQQWANTLKLYAYPVMGELSVKAVGLPEVRKVLDPIWRSKTETASRLRSRIELVLDAATAHGQREGLNPARWKGHLDKLLPKPSRISVAEHHNALPLAETGAFMVRLRASQGMGARALEFAILTAARSGEVRGATWSEIDIDEGVWTVPGIRMKAGKEHRVPLSTAALAVLKDLPKGKADDIVFASAKGAALSDMTLSGVLRRMNVPAVPHGFRSSFRDWSSELTTYPNEMAEMALAHTIGNKAEAAYRRGDMMDRRRQMMEDWAIFCAKVQPAKGNVVPMKTGTTHGT